MKLMLWILALSAYSITVHGSLETIVANPGGIGGIFKGPDSETIVHGPDGSIITSQQKGGIVQTESKLEPIIVAEPEILEVGNPLQLAAVQTGAPLELSNGLVSPLVPLEPTPTVIAANISPLPLAHKIDIIEPDPHIIETEIIDAPAVESKESTDLIGPSGSISTRGSESIVSGPASTTITKTAKVLVAPPVIKAVPIVASVSTPIINTPLVEVNNELPLSSPLPVSIHSTGPIISSTLSPINLGTVGVSTLSPPINQPIPSVSTLESHVIRQNVPVLTNGPGVLTLNDVGPGLGPLAGPPSLRQPINLAPINDPRLQTSPQSFAVDNSYRITQGLGSNVAVPILRQPAYSTPSQRPVLLTGEQYDDVRPRFEGNSLPTIIRQPPPNVLLSRGTVEQIADSTIAPPLLRQSTTVQPDNSIIYSTGSTGVNVIDEGSRGLLQPVGIQSTTGVPVSSISSPSPYNVQNIPQAPYNVQNIPQEWLINRQLIVDPAQIPQRNIVPPEIAIPKGAIDLGTTVQTSSTPVPDSNGVPRAPGVFSPTNIQRFDNIQPIDSINIQREENSIQSIGDNQRTEYQIPTEVERTLQNGYYQNEIIVGNTRNNGGSLLSNTNPIHSGVNIPPEGILGSELNRAGIDSSQIQLTNVPLSDVTSLQGRADPGSSQDYDDTVAASLWNRYGRKRKNVRYH